MHGKGMLNCQCNIIILLISPCEVEDQADSTEHNPQSSKRVIDDSYSQVEGVGLRNRGPIQWYSTFFYCIV